MRDTNLRFPAVFCENLRFSAKNLRLSAVSCALQVHEFERRGASANAVSVKSLLSYFASSPETFCEYVFSYLPGNFALKNDGDYWWFFLVPVSQEKKKHENSSKKSGEIRSKIREKNPEQNFTKLGELSCCDFSDLSP